VGNLGESQGKGNLTIKEEPGEVSSSLRGGGDSTEQRARRLDSGPPRGTGFGTSMEGRFGIAGKSKQAAGRGLDHSFRMRERHEREGLKGERGRLVREKKHSRKTDSSIGTIRGRGSKNYNKRGNCGVS